MSANSPFTPHVLRIPELLHRIFVFSQNNKSNACVCRTWSNEALNVIWRKTSLINLLKLLAPMERHYTHNLVFSRDIEAEDWVRFDKYAWRVRYLRVEWKYKNPSLLLDIVRNRPRLDLDLFPTLQSLDFCGDPIIFHLFVHQRLKSLSLWICASATDKNTIFQSIPVKMPFLETLKFCCARTHHGKEVFEATLTKVLPALLSLKSLTLPGNWLTPKITHTVAFHPLLETLKSDWIFSDETGAWDLFSAELAVDSFPNLKCLCIAIPFDRAALCLSQPHKLMTLSSLTLSTTEAEPVEDYGRVIDIVASNYPQLEEFALSSNCLDDGDPSYGTVTFTVLKSILRLSKLKILSLSHGNQFQLSSGDLITIVKALVDIEVLYLNSCPRIKDQPVLDMSALLALPPYCPRLEKLHLYLDASTDTLPRAGNAVKFQNLKLLSLGSSPITGPTRVARFLSRIFPKGCNVKSPLLGISPRERKWRQVAQLIPTFIDGHEESEERASLRR